MALIIDGTTPTSLSYNGVNLTSIQCDGIQVWPDSQTVEPYVWVLLDKDGTISYAGSKILEYSCDKTNWYTLTTLSVPAHHKIYLRSTSTTSFSGVGIKVTGSPYYVGGDIASLFNNSSSLPVGALKYFFQEEDNLISASALSLSYLTVSKDCYNRMFYKCHHLIDAPALPATTLGYDCYTNMFEDCFALREAPALPATTLVGSISYAGCYCGMFRRCVSLTKIPALPATVLPYGCYSYMYETTNIVGRIVLKFTTSQTAECPNAYRIPTSGTASYGTGASSDADVTKGMFRGYISNPSSTWAPPINTTYYTNATVI